MTRESRTRSGPDPQRFAASSIAQLTGAAISGVIAALATGDNVSTFKFWATLVGTSFAAYLLLFYIAYHWLSPVGPAELSGDDKARLTYSITTSRRSAYAVSSNWLALWRSSIFRYYLHLDAAMSLLAYSSSLGTPLHRFSTDAADTQEFFDYGWSLVSEIGKGKQPMRAHRLRFLIYGTETYERHSDEVLQLIRSHSAARIPCIPLIAQELFEHLDANERAKVALLVDALDQTAVDKLPPQSRFNNWRIRRSKRELAIMGASRSTT